MSALSHRTAAGAAACLAAGLLALSGCSRPASTGAGAADVTPTVLKAQAAVGAAADLSDAPSFADARRGFIAAPKGQVKGADGQVVWDFDAFGFVQGAAPATVNPSLWRQALLNNQIGLFKVTEGIWQLRGFDLANLTLIEGKTGWIVVDTLTAREVGSSRVDLQACKLEYSIVSPK